MEVSNSTTAFVWVTIFAFTIGLLIAFVDTSPYWDDTAVTAFAIFVSAFTSTFFRPRQAWLWSIIIGGLPFLFNVVKAHNFQSALGFVFSFAGAYTAFVFNPIFEDLLPTSNKRFKKTVR